MLRTLAGFVRRCYPNSYGPPHITGCDVLCERHFGELHDRQSTTFLRDDHARKHRVGGHAAGAHLDSSDPRSLLSSSDRPFGPPKENGHCGHTTA